MSTRRAMNDIYFEVSEVQGSSNLPEDAWKVRPCEWYKEELKDCKKVGTNNKITCVEVYFQRTIDKYSACVEVGKPIDENSACVEVGTNSV
ncbi:hypothetical protein TNCV_4202501 [Trichonephila clavipes]|uniref:Uncharacterized protein n=1 Tax=Trichonephila clavipes TaxID=2585209 RepID=A0A8X6VBY9_TRICX|nr:hypothetical protein TNCV_4202501 [Trichonephila clavipes]